MSDEHMNANKYLKGRFINIGNIITDTTNNWQFKVEMEQTNEDSCFADTISVLTFLNQLSEENEQLKQQIKRLEAQLYCPFDSICINCINEYLVQKDKYYVSKCRKGHEQCSKSDVKYCDDFELKE